MYKKKIHFEGGGAFQIITIIVYVVARAESVLFQSLQLRVLHEAQRGLHFTQN